MSFRALVTGISGFAGGHLAEALLRANNHVEGTVRPCGSLSPVGHLLRGVTLHPCDVRSSGDLADVVHKARPDVVYHLAATTSVAEGEADPRGTMEVNVTGTLHLLEAIRKEIPGALLVYVSTSEVYGKVLPEQNPIREGLPESPVHAYGLSKLLSEQLVRFYERRHGIAATILRPFNHIGPRQSDRFVCASFLKQLVSIELGRESPVLRVGNLEPVRDFTDVRDMAEAYRLAAEHCESGSLYNIASGEGTSIADLLKQMLSLTDSRIDVRQDPGRVRKTEIPILIGDATRFKERTGWQRRFTLRETLSDTAAYWRQTAADEREG